MCAGDLWALIDVQMTKRLTLQTLVGPSMRSILLTLLISVSKLWQMCFFCADSWIEAENEMNKDWDFATVC